MLYVTVETRKNVSLCSRSKRNSFWGLWKFPFCVMSWGKEFAEGKAMAGGCLISLSGSMEICWQWISHEHRAITGIVSWQWPSSWGCHYRMTTRVRASQLAPSYSIEDLKLVRQPERSSHFQRLMSGTRARLRNDNERDLWLNWTGGVALV